MPPSHSCQTAQASLVPVKALQQEFAAAYALAIQTRAKADVERARELKASLGAAVLEFSEANKTITVPKLVPDIFAHWPSCLETLKVSELNKEFTRMTIRIGGKSEEELLAILEIGAFAFSEDVEAMMKSDDFKRSLRVPNLKESDCMKWRLKSREEVKLLRLSVRDLGFLSGATFDKIYARADELGLELCPAEVGPQWRLGYINQPMNERVDIGMKQIINHNINNLPYVFSVRRGVDESSLDLNWAGQLSYCNAYREFVFRLHNDT